MPAQEPDEEDTYFYVEPRGSNGIIEASGRIVGDGAWLWCEGCYPFEDRDLGLFRVRNAGSAPTREAAVLAVEEYLRNKDEWLHSFWSGIETMPDARDATPGKIPRELQLMPQAEFLPLLLYELRLQSLLRLGRPFDRQGLEEWLASVWPHIHDDPDPVRWAGEYLEGQGQQEK
jgi:hypothetical protein